MKKARVVMLAVLLCLACGSAFAAETITCWFAPGAKMDRAEAISQALSDGSGVKIVPRVADSYPQILEAFTTDKPQLVYVGSFVQAIIAGRKLGTPLVQNNDGKQFYAGIMIYPAGQDPEAILKAQPSDFAYAIGASSGESAAKAATGGKASLGMSNHGESAQAVVDGKAKAAMVKNWWWLANEKKYPGLKSYKVPGISEQLNPDNVLTASKATPKALRDKISWAALQNSKAFGDKAVMVPFDATELTFSLSLMKKAGINPSTYTW